MADRPCLVCGAPSPRPRCPAHVLRRDPGQQDRTGLGRDYRKLRYAVIRAWVTQHGWICPGYKVPEHSVVPGGLSCDHRISRKERPDLALDPSNLAVLCPVCNSRKGSRSD